MDDDQVVIPKKEYELFKLLAQAVIDMTIFNTYQSSRFELWSGAVTLAQTNRHGLRLYADQEDHINA